MIPKKSLGQNFLVNQFYLSAIANECIKDTDRLVEIGCGTGNLTRSILEILPQSSTLHGVEVDPRANDILVAIQSNYCNFTYDIRDALQFNYSDYTDYSIVGNLPYNVGSAIVLRCVESRVKRFVFLLQQEVTERVAAKSNTSAYGGLSVLVQTYYDVRAILRIPPGAFYPKPSIDSKLLVCDLKPESYIDFTVLSQVLRAAFHSPRKTLRNNMQHLYPQVLDLLNCDLRPQQISVDEYGRFVQLLQEN